MLILNFGHPLSDAQMGEIRRLIDDQSINEIKTVKVQVNMDAGFIDQAIELVDSVGWTPNAWQTNKFLIVPPGLSAIALAVIAEIHGRSGYFPAIVRMKPVGGTPPTFMPHEILDLSRVREEARKKR